MFYLPMNFRIHGCPPSAVLAFVSTYEPDYASDSHYFIFWRLGGVSRSQLASQTSVKPSGVQRDLRPKLCSFAAADYGTNVWR